MKKINNMNYYVKLYMEFSAEIVNSQMQKSEAQKQIDKILQTHKKSTKPQSEFDIVSQSSMNVSQTTLHSL